MDQVVVNGDVVSRRKSGVVNSGQTERDITFSHSDSFPTTNESTVNLQILEKSVTDRMGGGMGNSVHIIEERTQNAILTAIDENIIPRIQLAVGSNIKSPGWKHASVSVNLRCGNT